jgi:hypothetical protein
MRYRQLTVLILANLALAPAAFAGNCEPTGDDAADLRCEVAALAGPQGEKYPLDKILYGQGAPVDPQAELGTCSENTDYKKLSCYLDAYGNHTCALAVEFNFNCGASGLSEAIIHCTKSRATGEVFCSRQNLATEQGLADPVAMSKVEQMTAAAPLGDVAALGTMFVAHLGSYPSEVEAYQVGGALGQKLDFNYGSDGPPSVVKAWVNGREWYRLQIGPAGSRAEVEARCARLGALVDYCAPMKATLVSVRRE